jgi:pilus assembly protein Flp/PilA
MITPHPAKIDRHLNPSFRVFANKQAAFPTPDCAPGHRRGILRWRRRQEFWMRRLFLRFLADQSGATAIEYCLIAVGLSIVIVTAVNGIGATLNTKFTSVNASLK